MEASDFIGSFPGVLVPTEGGILGFIPRALPEDAAELRLPARIEVLAGEAERAIGRLGGLLHGGGSPLSPLLVGRPLQRREAIESSRIEGTFTTPEQLALLDIVEDDANEEPTDDTREVRNYLIALDWGLEQLDRLPISQRLVRGIHERLMHEVRGGAEQPGEFRTIQNFIGSSQNPKKARFVPPPSSELPRLLRELEEYIHLPVETRTLSRPVRLALIHYQFETIHPFRDGNGRVGRILIPLLLRSDDPSDPPLYLSSYFEERRTEYYDLLLGVSQRGEFAEWIEFFIRAMKQSAEDSSRLALDLLALRQRYASIAREERWPAASLRLIDSLFELPMLTARRVETLIGVSAPTAAEHLKRLVNAKIVSEVTGRMRNRRYLATELVSLVHRK